MGQLALGVVGAVVGNFVFPGIGASVGFMLGSALGGALFQKTNKASQEGPRLADLAVQVSTYGASIPHYWGNMRGAGNVIWFSGIREQVTTDTQTQGGKGGGPKQQTATTTYTYDCDIAISLCEGPISGVRRIWADGKLIYNVGDTATLEDIVQSNANAGNIKFYLGDETQTADSVIEAAEGAGNVPGFRGLAYVRWQSLQLGQFGNRVPNFTFEIVSASTNANLATPVTAQTNHVWYGYAQPYRHGNTVCFGDVNVQYGDQIFFVTNTGQYLSTRNFRTGGPVLGEWGAPDLLIGRPAPDGAGNYWIIGIGTLFGGTQQGSFLVGLRESGEVFKVILVNTSIGVATQNTISARGNDVIFSLQSNTLIYRVNVESAPAYTAGSTDLSHRTQIATILSISQGPYFDRDGLMYWRVTPSPGTPYLIRINANGVLETSGEITAFNEGDYGSSSFGQVAFDLNNGIWVVWYGGSPTRAAIMNRIDFDSGSVVQSFELEPVGGSIFTVSLSDLIFADDGYLYVNYAGSSTPGTWRKIDPVSGEQLYVSDTTAENFALGGAFATRYGVFFANYAGGLSNGSVQAVEPLPRMTLGSVPTLSTVVTELCESSGLSSTDLDVSELTDSVYGFVRTKPMMVRAALEDLAAGFFFDAVESDDVIKFVKRGSSSSIVTIDDDDLGASRERTSAEVPVIEINRRDEPQVPRELIVQYMNRSADYQDGTEYARRLVTASKDSQRIELPIALTPDEAAKIAETLLYQAHMSRLSFRFATGQKYARYEPTDCVTLTVGDISHAVRLTKKRETLPLIEWEAEADGEDIYSSLAVGGGTGASMQDTTTVALVGATELTLLDIPILQSSDDDIGPYAALSGTADGWRGAALYRSTDDVTFTEIGSASTSAKYGVASTTLGIFTGGNTFDEKNTVTVTLLSGTLSSATELEVLNGANAAMLGSEMIMFKTATLSSGTTYVLSGFLRGRRGTEQHISTHGSGEKFVLLSEGGILRVAGALTDLNTTRYYKAVSFGDATDLTASRSFVSAGVGLKPLSPVYLNGVRDASGDLVISWIRRGRVDWDWRDYADVPVGEDSESYEIDILNGTTVLRTLTSTTNTVTYTVAQQNSDGSPAPASVNIAVYQISAQVDRGFAATGAF